MIIKEKVHEIDSIDKDTPLKETSYVIYDNKHDALLVSDDDKVIGIVTVSDILMKVNKDDIYSDAITVKEIMDTNLISIEADKEVEEAIELMASNNIMRLLVTEKNKPLGVLYGEEILELNGDKWRELMFNLTVENVYKMLLKDINTDITVAYSTVRNVTKLTNMESNIQFELFVYQQGLVLVAYNFIKEDINMPLSQIKDELKANYSHLLDKYCQQ